MSWPRAFPRQRLEALGEGLARELVQRAAVGSLGATAANTGPIFLGRVPLVAVLGLLWLSRRGGPRSGLEKCAPGVFDLGGISQDLTSELQGLKKDSKKLTPTKLG